MAYPLIAAVLAGAALTASTALAEDGGPTYTFSGYGTAGATHSSERAADFIALPHQRSGPGHSRNWSLDTDSRLAGQLTANFNSQWSAVLQVVAEQQADNSHRPKVEWANIQFMPTPDITLRAGRIVLPVLLMGNTRKVGYALPWVRMPSALFETESIPSSDGVDASYIQHFGPVKNSIMASTGRRKIKLGNGPLAGRTLKATRISTVVDVVTYGNMTLQLSLMDSAAIFSGLPGTTRFQMHSAGASYDPGNWYVMGEWARNKITNIGMVTNWYAGGGYRIGNFTPYLIAANRTLADPSALAILLPPQKTQSAGLRWDVSSNTDIKLQYDRNSNAAGSQGLLKNLQPGFQPGGRYHVVSATVDFVF